MSQSGSTSASKRAQRIEEAVLEIDGVVRARVWETPERVEIGIGVAATAAASDVLKQVQDLAEAMRAIDEVWDVGLLDDL